MLTISENEGGILAGKIASILSLSALLLLALGGCTKPTITDATVPWTGPASDRILRADVSVPSGWRLNNVFVRFARHVWPGPPAAHHGSAAAQPGDGTRFFFVPAGVLQFPVSHTLFYQWFMEYSLADGGTEVLTVQSEERRLVVGCTPEGTSRDLGEALAAHADRLTTTTPHVLAPLQGFPVPAHLNASILGNGMTFAIPPGQIPTAGGVDLNRPSLAFYAPRPRAPDETVASYNSTVSEPLFADSPYSFIGIAYTAAYDPARRPTVGCIPSHQWFVHEAGFHLLNGGMLMTPPNDNGVRGSGTIFAAPPVFPPPGVWHSRFWDLHVWLPPDGNPANPIMTILRPGGVPGLTLPAGAFFSSAVFE